MNPPSGSVVVVDDDAAVRSALKFSLELEGLNVRACSSGLELLADPDLALSGCLVVDYNMPSMNGIELLDRLRLRHIGVPAILITSHATSEIACSAQRSGFLVVLEKPLDDGSLLDNIQGAFGIRDL